MATEICLKRGLGIPASLKEGEPAIDLENKVLYVGLKDDDGDDCADDFFKISENQNVNLSKTALSYLYYGDETIVPSPTEYFTFTSVILNGIESIEISIKEEYKETVEDIVIPYWDDKGRVVNIIASNGFRSCSSLSKVIIPSCIETIELYAFGNCHRLLEVSIIGKNTELYYDTAFKMHCFTGSQDVFIYCNRESKAENFCKTHMPRSFDYLNSKVSDVKSLIYSYDSSIGREYITIGKDVDNIQGTVIGNNSCSEGGIVLGYNSSASLNGIAIGDNAISDASIQIGSGINLYQGTFQVYDKELLDYDGNIPLERLSLLSNKFNDEFDKINNGLNGLNQSLKYKGIIKSINDVSDPEIGDVYSCNFNENLFQKLEYWDRINEDPLEHTTEELESGDIKITIKNPLSLYMNTYKFSNATIETKISSIKIEDHIYSITEDSIIIELDYDFCQDYLDEPIKIWADITIPVSIGDMILYDGTTWIKIGTDSYTKDEINSFMTDLVTKTEAEELIYDSENLNVYGVKSIAIGEDSKSQSMSNDAGSIAIGIKSSASESGTTVGYSSSASMGGTSIGAWSEAGTEGVSVGYDSYASFDGSIAIGSYSESLEGGIAIGCDSKASSYIQIGTGVNNDECLLKICDFPLLDKNGNIISDRYPLYGGFISSLEEISNPQIGVVYTCTQTYGFSKTLRIDTDFILSYETMESGNKILHFENPFENYINLYEWSNFIVEMGDSQFNFNISDYNYKFESGDVYIEMTEEEFNDCFSYSTDFDDPSNNYIIWCNFHVINITININIPINKGDMVFYDGTIWLKINSNNNDKNKIIELEQKVNNLESLIAELSDKIDAHG